MLTNQYRQAAIDWLNGKRDFNEGLSILKQSGFKPGVVRRLETIGDSDVTRMHLRENIYLYLQFIGAEVEDTDADLGVINGEQPEVLKQEEPENLSIDEIAVKIEMGEYMAPPNVSKCILQYAKCYREREIAHRKMSGVPDTNEDANVEARRKYSDIIDFMTSKMEKIYPLVSKSLATQTELSDKEVEDALTEPAPDQSEEDGQKDSAEDEYEEKSKEELQKMLKSAKTKILRKTNLLEYQQETKADKPNPLPDCPKRVKYETEIAKLEKEVEALQYAIARKV